MRNSIQVCRKFLRPNDLNEMDEPKQSHDLLESTFAVKSLHVEDVKSDDRTFVTT